MTLPVRRDWDAIAYFAGHLIESRDQDPIYPVLHELSRLRQYNSEEALWLSVVYQAFYHLPAALEAIRRLGDVRELDGRAILDARLRELPTGIERRGLRGGLVVSYLSLVTEARRQARGFQNWLTEGWGTNPYTNYANFQRTWQNLEFNARWSSFKMAEILKVSHGWNIAAPDMDLRKATGPRQSLEYLYGLANPKLIQLNESGEDFRHQLQKSLNRALDWETVETILCNWNSVRQGRYYVGHDIDELQDQMERATFLSQEDASDLLNARANALPDDYLGEWHDWSGVSKSRQRAWIDAGLVVIRP